MVDLSITLSYVEDSQCEQERTKIFLLFSYCCCCCCCFFSDVSSESSLEEGWDTEDIEIPDDDLTGKEISNAKTLMGEAKAGHVEELQPPSKVTYPV